MSEHDFEPVRGLPGELPAGERLLWQGAPDWLALGLRAFHMSSVAIYFAILLVWRGAATLATGATPGAALEAALQILPVAAIALGLLAGLAALTARTTVYTITTKRIVMRFGVAMPKAINIPFAIVETAALKAHADRSGDLAITLTAPNKINYFLLWPHARPWRLSNPEPTLRAIPDAARVAALLGDALKAVHGDRAALAPIPAPSAPAHAPDAAMSPA
jgi:hypothetical protein